ncbi:MAG: MBL fold metallo-hydrolase [Nanoarchaeota archaeon]
MTNIHFYGVRGSIPAARPSHMNYGGNTSCVVAAVGNELVVIDSGSGMVKLGEELMGTAFGQGHGKLHLLQTHFHWDHIQGLPYFKPIYVSGNELHIYGEGKTIDGKEYSIEELLRGMMKAPYHPVPYEATPSQKIHHELQPGSKLYLPHAEIEAVRVNHPNGGLGYILHSDEGNVAFLWDHEHDHAEIDKSLREKLQGTEVLIYDTFCTEDEYHGRNGQFSKKGWGHSTPQEGAKLAQDIGAQRLFLMHHGPHDDQKLDQIVQEVRHKFPNTYAAQEGMQIEVASLLYERAA